MKVKILIGGKEQAQRLMRGCLHYNLSAKYNQNTDPYVEIEITTPEQASYLYWLGAMMTDALPNNSLTKSSF